MTQNWRNILLLIGGGVVVGIFVGFVVCLSLVGPYFGRNKTVFGVHDSQVDFENDDLLLKTDTVYRNGPVFFDVGRWVVTLTHKRSGQSIALLTSYPSFQSDPTDVHPHFKSDASGFTYESDVAVFRMDWPKVDIRLKPDMEGDAGAWSKWYHLGGPKY